MNRKIKIIGIALVAVVGFYFLQYAGTAIHYNCQVLKDDCPPPISMAGELVYRSTHPQWLDQFQIEPTIFSFEDGRFSFWEGEVEGKPVVIWVREDGSPVMQWIFEEKLPGKTPIYPATGEHINQWLKAHPEYKLGE